MSTPIADDLASDALQQFHADLRLALLMQHKARLYLLFRLQFPTSEIEPFHDSDDVEELDFRAFLSSPPPELIASHGAYHKLLRAQNRLSQRAQETMTSAGDDVLSAEQVAQLLREMHNFDRVADRLAAGITASLTDIDELTGLLNRVAMERDLEREQAQARRTGRRFTIAIVDADHFKPVNDQFGHRFGDLVLEALAERLIASLRPRDAVYRYGGEEFLVLLPETTLEAAAPVIERLRVQASAHKIGDGDNRIIQTVSIGAAEVSAEADLEAAIERADTALYRAKQAGRNRIELARASSAA
ncbi:GGDEF domain-containing protein [Halochromatium salexigens]|nr:GGDEF domain-containing protein [Halochromatium salexigens]